MDPQYRSQIGTAEADCAVQDCAKDRLNTGLRATNDAKHLAGSGLIFKRLLQLPLARLLCLEQPCVLDGDDGLVGEGLEHSDLLVREWVHCHSTNQNHADWNVLAQQGGC